MKKLIFILPIFLSLLLSCNDKVRTKTFWIDNPTDNEIVINIDIDTYTIPARSVEFVELTPGYHSLTYNNDKVNFVVKPNDQKVMLNPTLSTYVFYHEIYSKIGEDAQAEIEQITPAYLHDFTLASGNTIKVPFKVTNNLFIERYEYYWHLNVTESYKNKITIRTGSSNLKSAPQSKIFRLDDFYKYIGDGISPLILENIPLQSTVKLSELEPFKLIADSIVCDCEPANEGIEKIRMQFDSLKTVSPSEFKAVFERFGNSHLRDYEKECSPHYNNSLEHNNFNRLVTAIGKQKEVLGRKNAFIVD